LDEDMNDTSRRRFIVRSTAALCLLGLLPGIATARTITSINEAINMAGRLRMLSQRITKTYCQIGLGVLPEQAQKILGNSINLFAEHIAALIEYAPTDEIRSTYADLNSAWLEYRKQAAAPPTPEGARKMAVLNEDVLRLAHLGTTQLELYSGSSVGRLINISGRQRMLSQRLAKFYMLRYWGINSPDMERESRVARGEFVTALDALSKAPENTKVISGELELARIQWMFFDEALKSQKGGGKDAIDAQNVATTSERILEVMDRITGMYARLTAPEPPAASSVGKKRK
jgi:nitrate/nitrite-specific signal transduction histidine kinase